MDLSGAGWWRRMRGEREGDGRGWVEQGGGRGASRERQREQEGTARGTGKEGSAR